jgi:hypothetical protein
MSADQANVFCHQIKPFKILVVTTVAQRIAIMFSIVHARTAFQEEGMEKAAGSSR